MSDTLQCFESLNVNGSQIDKANGIIRGVSAITIGPAKGHNVWVDRKTLETALTAAKSFTEGIKVKFRHSTAGQFTSVIEETFGLLKDFVIDGNKMRGDLHLLESLPAEIKAKAFEMAEKMANQFGLSIVFKGDNENVDGKDYLRCTQLESIDLTENPAANHGLFSMKTIKYESGSSGKHAKDCLCEDCGKMGDKTKEKSLQEICDAIASLSATVTALSEKVSATAAPAVTALAFKDKDGKTVQLEAADIFKRLEAADKLAADARQTVEANERKTIITKMQADGRVTFKEPGIAYKLSELETLEMPLLKLAAINSQVIPTVARATYTDAGKGPKNMPVGADGKPPKDGSGVAAAMWEEGYSDLNKMLAAPVGSTLG